MSSPRPPARRPVSAVGFVVLPVFALVTAALLAGCAAFPGAHRGSGATAHAVILMIGDGMGHQEITAARNYSVGAGGRLAMDGLEVMGEITTYAVQEAAPHLPDYVVDSAASATAWSTGHKTSNQRLSTAPGDDRPLETLLELAHGRGLPVGSVTTADVTDATPAALYSHVPKRDCHGPADMQKCPASRKSAGGPGSIAEQLLAHRPDVVLGGGRARFEQRADDGAQATLLDAARSSGFLVLTDAASLALADDPTAPVLGLFAAEDLDAVWSGERALPYPGSGPQRCREQARPPEQPPLADMTRYALRTLEDRAARRGTPFFLQVEGASIDKRNHAADPCGQLGETIAFDEAVRVAVAYSAAHPGTLLIVTADHAHTCQILPTGDRAKFPGAMSTLLTGEGARLTLGYGTNTPGAPQTHTGTEVRVMASGPGASGLAGLHDQTELFPVMRRALGLDPEQP